MNLRRLNYFIVLAEELNFRRAAERLNMAQPPLSVAIRKLEDELGAPLFERTTKGVELTAAGMAALSPARETLAHAASVGEAVIAGKTGESGRVTLGFVGSAVSELLPTIIPAFRESFPLVELKLEEMTSRGILAGIDQRTIDVGLIRLPGIQPSNAQYTVIERDTLVAALPRSHAQASRSHVGLDELADEPFILQGPVSILHSITLIACQKAGFAPRTTQEITQVQTALSLVQSGLGVALVPARMTRFVPDGVALLPLRESVEIEMGLAWGSEANPVARNFVKVAKRACDVNSGRFRNT